jgi:hypothetical protein
MYCGRLGRLGSLVMRSLVFAQLHFGYAVVEFLSCFFRELVVGLLFLVGVDFCQALAGLC